MAAFDFHRQRTRRWWYAGATLMALAFFAVFFVVGASAVTGSPSGFESSDGNMTLEGAVTNPASATDWNCFQHTDGFSILASGTPAGCAATSGATDVTADSTSAGELEQTPGQKFDTACPTFKGGNNPPKDEWSNVAQYIEGASNGDVYFYGATIRPVVNGNSSGNIYFSQGTNPAGAGCRTKGDILLTFDFLNGGGTTPVLHLLTWEVGSGSCFVKSDSTTSGCWGPSTAPALSGDNSDGLTNGSIINGVDNAINGQTLPVNAFSEIGVNLTQAIKAAGGTATCFANETWVSRSSGSSFTSSPEDVEIDQQPTCGTITIIKHTLNGSSTRSGINQQFSYGTTGGLTPSSFHLNDAGGAAGDVNCTADSTTANPCNTLVYSNQPAGTYTVTEGANPANFTFVSLTCVPAGNGTTAAQDGTILKQADITLGISGSAVCTYTNQQQLGAIRINKTSSKGTHPALQGAKFYLCTNNTTSTTSCTAPTGVTNPLTTDVNGTVCQGSLPLGQYYVFESAAPSGYGIDDATAHSENVQSNGDCSSSTSQSLTLNATDTPLSKIYLGWHSLAGVGVTTATIQCTGETGTPPAFSDGGSTPTITKTLGDGSTTLTPGTYSCTVVIDP